MTIFLLVPIIASFFVRLLLIGHKDGTPFHGFKRKAVVVLAKFVGVICNAMLGSYTKYKRLSLEDVNHYQEYLGTIEEQQAF